MRINTRCTLQWLTVAVLLFFILFYPILWEDPGTDDRGVDPTPPTDVPNIILYNRVPKTGSLTMFKLIERMSKLNNFTASFYEKVHQHLMPIHVQVS